jgi:hypothetical protein
MEGFIKHCKTLINEGNLDELRDVINENLGEVWAWEYIYQKLYLHACLKRKREIVDWLNGLFTMFDPIQQIALRQMFSYGKYLLQK